MSQSNRRKRPSARLVGWILVPFGAASLVFGIGSGLYQQNTYEQEARQKSTDYAEHAANQIRQTCGAVAPPKKSGCIKDAVAEYRLKTRDNQREHEDLIAQRKSALWTSIMGIAALIGMGLSAVGVALVYITFSETRKTNRIAMKESVRSTRRALVGAEEAAKQLAIAQQSAEAAMRSVAVSEDTAKRQLRAYVSLERADISEIVEGKKVSITFFFRNAGQTPSFTTAAAVGIGFRELPITTRPELAPESREPEPQGPGGVFSHSISTARELRASELADYEEGRRAFVASCEIRYLDAFEVERQTLVTVYRAFATEAPMGQMAISAVGNKAT